MGLHDLTFEAVIVRHPDKFSQEVVTGWEVEDKFPCKCVYEAKYHYGLIAGLLENDACAVCFAMQLRDGRASVAGDVAGEQCALQRAMQHVVGQHVAKRRHIQFIRMQHGATESLFLRDVDGVYVGDLRNLAPYAEAFQQQSAAMGQCQRARIERVFFRPARY